jgi:lysyl-tRNA synthetase, class II
VSDERETADVNFVQKARREKLDQLVARGVVPYAYRFERSHAAGQAAALLPAGVDEGPHVDVAGRIVAWRGHGKTAFAHLADESGRVQMYFKRDVLGEQAFGGLELLDIGDILGVHGPLFRTKTGEVTVRVERYELLAKSLRPLPFGKEEVVDGKTVRHSGFADPEQRYRQRYADLAVHPEVRTLFRGRSRMITALRHMLDHTGFVEVETPVLQPLYGGAAARPFVTHHRALDMPLYLRIADELYLKRLVVGGFDRVYEIGHDFRNEGVDRTHNPEFTMLEFYQAYADYTDMMNAVEALITGAAQAVAVDPLLRDRVPSLTPPFPRIQWTEALNKAIGMEVMGQNEQWLRDAAKDHGVANVETLSRPKLLDELFQAVSNGVSTSRRSWSTIRSSSRRSPSPSAATRRSPSGSSCSPMGESSRTRSAS